MRIGAQRRQHPPISDVVHRIRHSPQQIKQAVKADEAPSARSNREQAHDNHRVADTSDQNPRFEFSHFKMRIFDDNSHQKIVDRIPHHADDHCSADDRKLRARQLHRILHI